MAKNDKTPFTVQLPKKVLRDMRKQAKKEDIFNWELIVKMWIVYEQQVKDE